MIGGTIGDLAIGGNSATGRVTHQLYELVSSGTDWFVVSARL